MAYQLGVSRDTAALLQWVSMALAVARVRGRRAVAGSGVRRILVAVIASQLLSPILWDHYALLLLLPVAWLLDRGHWWAAVFVLATPVLLVGQLPAVDLPGRLLGDPGGRDGRRRVRSPVGGHGSIATSRSLSRYSHRL